MTACKSQKEQSSTFPFMLSTTRKRTTKNRKNSILKGFFGSTWSHHYGALLIVTLFRWAPENKDQRNPYAFLSFGAGPRNCIGMRFAMEELKIALFTLVRALRFFPVDETPVGLPRILYSNLNCLIMLIL